MTVSEPEPQKWEDFPKEVRREAARRLVFAALKLIRQEGERRQAEAQTQEDVAA